ncbi:MAG: OsmC family peroxiredoxin [Bacteroidales bacterium]|nr:OsmC family peroxiredoxin [Bacteroidales bacterium]MBN2819841.1 OsmC family peroxiredoxin [Bacteroidales bacterium]
MSIRTAKAQWNGTLKEGDGLMSFSNYNGPYTFKSRFEEGDGTNPEELIGAAISGCYSMFLSALISGENLKPEYVKTTARVHLDNDDIGPKITLIELDTKVKCNGLSGQKFEELAKASKEKCPVSRLYSSAEIKLDAELE